MKPNAFNVVTDGQWGSTGKGLITTALASKHRPEILSTTNMANAGHTAVWDDGRKFVAKALPSATALNKWIPDYNPIVYVGPSAAFHTEQLQKELLETELKDLLIHPRAGVITKQHADAENNITTGTKHIASTMQGCGAFLAEKVLRKADLKLARSYSELSAHLYNSNHSIVRRFVQNEHINSPNMFLHRILVLNGCTILHEGSQGFSLDINHGSHYPYCTSRGTTAIQNLADIGLPHTAFGDIYLVIRPYPIRVGNVIEAGSVVGFSGGCYDDHHEVTWSQVAEESGMPSDVADSLMKTELTTVTKRLRRVFSFSEQQLLEAVITNGATKIALNFANYIDWSCYGCSDPKSLPSKVLSFIDRIEKLTNIPVSIVGTGPQNNHICYM